MTTYFNLDAQMQGRNREQRKLANNTYAHRINERTIAVRLHNTDVVTLHSDGRVVYNSGGWRTLTTKERMSQFGPAQVSQTAGVWYIRVYNKTDWVVYADGITWDGEKFIGEGDDPKKTAKLVKQIKTFTDTY